MVKIAVHDFFGDDFPVKIDDVEIKNGQSIPTRKLLDDYEEKYPNDEFWFVMGTDLISNLHLWDDGTRMITDTNCLIFERNGYTSSEIFQHSNWPVKFHMGYGTSRRHPNLLGGISSTEVRSRVKNGIGIQGLVTPGLLDFIEAEGLYK